MAKTLQLRRGTTAEITANTPASGELFVDTQKKTVTVGDGSTAGGIVLARNDRVSDVYNAANNKQDTLVSGTNIKTINGSSVLGSGNLVVSGGGGGSANTVAITPTSDNFITLGTPTAVEYVPSSNITFSGPLILNANNQASSFQANSNNYIDVVGYSLTNSAVDAWTGSKYGIMALAFTRRNVGSFPQRWVQELNNLIPGDKITLKFIAGANNQLLDTFTLPLTVVQTPLMRPNETAVDWTRFRGQFFGQSSDFQPSVNGDRADNGGTGYSFGLTTEPRTLSGKTIFFKSEAVQPSYTSNTTLITTQLVGEITGRPIHHSFLTNISGKGYLNPATTFINASSSNAQGTGGIAQRVGVYQILIEKQAGTVVTLSSNDYKEILISNSAVAVANTVTNIKDPVRVYDSANSKVWISGANLMSVVTTTTPLQIYNPPTTNALVDVGPTLKMYGDTVNNRLISTGKLARAENFKNLGVVSSTGTTANVVMYPTVISTRYLNSSNTGTYTPVRSTNGVLLDNAVSSNSNETIKILNVTDEVYDLIGQNNSVYYVHYTNLGSSVTANLALRTTNQGNNGIYIGSYSGIGSGYTEGYWIGSNLLNFWQGGQFYPANTSYSKPTWTYDIEGYNQLLVIPTNVVTLTTTADVINELLTINNFSNGPRISPLGSANNLPQIYVDGILTQVNGIDAANNRIITNLSTYKYGNTDFTGAVISTTSSLSDYATISDVNSQIPSWIPTVTNSSSATSSSYYVGGGTSGLNLYAFSINSVIGASGNRESQYNMGFSSVNGAVNYGQGADRGINYNNQNSQPGGDKLNGDNGALVTYNLGVVGGINSNYAYANNIMGTGGTSYANTHIANTVHSSSQIRVSARNLSNPDPKIANVAVLFTANSATLKNDSPNVTSANATFPIITGTIASNLRIVPPGAPAHARSFRLGGDPYAGGSGSGGFYIKNQGWDLANVSYSWTVESWVASSYLYQNMNLITALGTGDLATAGTTYIRGEFPFFSNATINNSNQISGSVADVLYTSLGRTAAFNLNTTSTAGYNSYWPLGSKWYHIAVVYDATSNNVLGQPTMIYYVNGHTATGVASPTWTAGSLLFDWGVYAQEPIFFYNYRVTYGLGEDGVRYRPPAGYTGSSQVVKAFDPELEPFGYTANRAVTADTDYRYDALDLSGGIRMDNTANTYSGFIQTPTNPIGGYLFVENGALKYKGSSGTVTTIANA